MKTGKRSKTSNSKIKKYLFILLAIIFILLLGYILFNLYINVRDKKANKELQANTISTVDNITDEKEEKNQEIIDKVTELQQENEDVKGWIKIENSNINYPLLQGEDNNYYQNRNYKKEISNYGSIFIDEASNLEDVNSNVIIYGHNMKDKEMFQNLLNYADKDYYEEHKNIEIITNEKTMKYEIVTVFKSRIYYQNETNVFRYYYCTDLNTEEKYNDYIKKCKKIELYPTGVDAKYGEQLITLITCEYSQDNGRMVVVAKRIDSNNEE